MREDNVLEYWGITHTHTHTHPSLHHMTTPQSQQFPAAWGTAGRTRREENERQCEAVGMIQQGRRRASTGQGRRKTAGSCGGWGNELCVPRRCVPWTCVLETLKCSLSYLLRHRLKTLLRERQWHYVLTVCLEIIVNIIPNILTFIIWVSFQTWVWEL